MTKQEFDTFTRLLFKLFEDSHLSGFFYLMHLDDYAIGAAELQRLNSIDQDMFVIMNHMNVASDAVRKQLIEQLDGLAELCYQDHAHLNTKPKERRKYDS